jgi:hypothetical protein
LAAGANHLLRVTFVPEDSADFTAGYAAVTLTVTQAGQHIAFGRLPNRTYGDAPFALHIARGASGIAISYWARGACRYGEQDGSSITVTKAGTCTVYAYEPGNFNYTGAFAKPVTLRIAKATPRIVWPKPAPITQGTPLGKRQLNAVALFQGRAVKGTYRYVPGTGSRNLPVGAGRKLTVTFIPRDSANFNTVTATETITVRPKP